MASQKKQEKQKESSLVRLHKFMADAGVASRRKSEELILAGEVKVNGKVIKEPGFKVDPEKFAIEVGGKRIAPEKKAYILLNKPKGYVTTVKDTHGRPTVMDLARSAIRVVPVGRLDKDTEGLLLLTNDGELANRLTSPRYEIEKVYEVVAQGRPTEAELNGLRRGVILEEGKTAPAQVEVLWQGKDRTALQITIHQGWKRQIRRMCEKIGHPVKSLKRIRVGPLSLRGIPVGGYRLLSEDEVAVLHHMTGIKEISFA
jgi:pseudouridine synthase